MIAALTVPDMLRRSTQNSRSMTTATLALSLSLSWSLPAVAFAGPPDLPQDQPTAAPAVEQPVAVQPAAEPQPAPAAQPQPQPQPGWEQPQPQPPQQQPVPQWGSPQPPPPTYQPMPAPAPMPPRPNPNRGMGMMIAGFSIFSISYLITAGVGTALIDNGRQATGRPLLIPVAGPFIAASRQPYATVGFGLGFVGVIQLAGLGMGVGGAVMLGTARRQARLSANAGGLQLQF